MEERHDAEADVVGRERVVRGDRARRIGEVPLAQRHDLRLARRPARVQEQRDGVGVGSGDHAGWTAEREVARGTLRQVKDGDPQLATDSSRGHRDLAVEEHGAGAQVIEVGTELRGGVVGIERRRGRAGTHDREEGEHDLRPVRKGERDGVARLHPCAGELRREPFDGPVQLRVADRIAGSGSKRGMVVRPPDLRKERVRHAVEKSGALWLDGPVGQTTLPPGRRRDQTHRRRSLGPDRLGISLAGARAPRGIGRSADRGDGRLGPPAAGPAAPVGAATRGAARRVTGLGARSDHGVGSEGPRHAEAGERHARPVPLALTRSPGRSSRASA